MKAIILIVSTTCFEDKSLDETADKLRHLLKSESHDVADVLYLRDNVQEISAAITKANRSLADGGLILTSGGTGFAPDDVTPEAVGPLLTKQSYGLVHAMMSASLQHTPMAALSRPVAGSIDKSIVLTLPGSPKGAVECLQAVLPILSHAVQLASGENSRKLHKAMHKEETEHTCAHHHHHNHQSHQRPKFYSSPASRHRESPYPMIPVEEAVKKILDSVPAPKGVSQPLEECVGHIISKDIHSSINIPPYRTSIVDGYAIGPGPHKFPQNFDVTAVSHATQDHTSPELKHGTISRITTGARVPDGAIAVIPVENTKLIKKTEDNKEELVVQIDIDEQVSEGDNIREIGSDVARGDCILSKLQFISPAGGEIGTAASVGLRELPVYRKPIVGILSGGNELLDPGSTASAPTNPIYDSNRHSLISMCIAHGFEVVDAGIAKDSVDSLRQHMQAALNAVDILITTGGVSMGETDLIKPVIQDEIHGTIHFGRVAMKPGKPMTFATAGESNNKLIFSLPGNPASCIVTFHLFVLPALRHWSGFSKEAACLPRIKVTLKDTVKLDPRPEFHRVWTAIDEDSGTYVVTSTGNQRSSRVRSMVGAQALLCLPSRTESVTQINAGEKVSAILLR